METTNMETQTDDDQISRIMDLVEMVGAGVPVGEHRELTATEKSRVEEVVRRAYFGARMAGKTYTEAAELGLRAAREHAAEHVASLPATAVLEQSITRSGPSQPTMNGSAPSTKSSDAQPAFGAPLSDEELAELEAEAAAPAAQPTRSAQVQGDDSARPGKDVDKHGEQRSKEDFAAAERAGFSPAQTVYTRGTRVMQDGVYNARRSRLAYEKKPLVFNACGDLVEKITLENRYDMVAIGSKVAMLDDGKISFYDLDAKHNATISISREAFGGMCSRMGYGGGAYLADKCSVELRALNVNTQHSMAASREEAARAAWLAKQAKKNNGREKGDGPESRALVFRTRMNVMKEREAFATVTPDYAAFDCDMIAKAIAEATPPEARGTVTYDGHRARFEVLFQTTVQPKYFVAGEFFRAGVIVRSDDTGGGCIRGQSVAWQNLCLNLIIVDKMARELFNLRHIGSVEELAKKFRLEFGKALKSLEHFIRQWDYACEDDIAAKAVTDGRALPVAAPDIMRGIFTGLLTGGRVKLPGRQVEKHVTALMDAWGADASSAIAVVNTSRAAIVNAFTAYAQTVEVDDPFAEDEIQRQASALLWSTRPLDYVELEKVAKTEEPSSSKGGVR